ncbi:MAG: metallophosphoesterase [Ruminococcus sp.]|nr:metallophosphoesterase [Ruminococcus sp.]MDE6540340.1 metallophosphoesterase [Ruminococcus sp.]
MGTAKRKKVRRFRRICAVIVFLIWVWWYNNYTLKTTHVELNSGKITNPVRIAVISDTHSTEHGISNRKIVRRVKKANPDIVLIMGDMYTRNSPEEIQQIPVELTEDIISAGYPVYFVTGDHDTDQSYINAMVQTGATLMNYNTETININDNNIQLFGIDNVYYSPTFNLHNAFSINPECYSILMAHIPNYEKFADFGTDLTICADTHGGMVQLPFLGAMIDSVSMQWFPELHGKKVYDKGFFDYEGGTMFITSGIGVSPAPVRFNNRPEIVIMDIKNEVK